MAIFFVCIVLRVTVCVPSALKQNCNRGDLRGSVILIFFSVESLNILVLRSEKRDYVEKAYERMHL